MTKSSFTKDMCEEQTLFPSTNGFVVLLGIDGLRANSLSLAAIFPERPRTKIDGTGW